MTLSQKQRLFSKMIAELILWAYEQGYEVTLGDAYRDPRVHGALGEKMGYGARNSCHKMRLAMDLNLFKDGKYCTDEASHGLLGEKWESMGGSWGGRFQDANHYSLEHDGFK